MVNRVSLRRILRPFLGREAPLWLLIRSPRLRFRWFNGTVDCVIYALLLARRRVRFVQIGSNDGVTNDPLWTFRRYPNWSGVLVEPVKHVFERLTRNYAPWSERFTLVRAAVANTTGVRPFYYVPQSADADEGYDQGGSLDPARVRNHSRAFDPTEDIASDRVRCFTFRELCERQGLTTPDLVHVDAEGMDAEIIRQVDLENDPPAVILYEHVHIQSEGRQRLGQRFEGAGYDTIKIGGDTLCALRSALAAHRPLRTAWGLALRNQTPAWPGTSN
jgi:FkbM family methyltransferase